jgi:hypothetical protein
VVMVSRAHLPYGERGLNKGETMKRGEKRA